MQIHITRQHGSFVISDAPFSGAYQRNLSIGIDDEDILAMADYITSQRTEDILKNRQNKVLEMFHNRGVKKDGKQ